MTKLHCTATCYMPSSQKGVNVERYEDDEPPYEVSDKQVEAFLESGNFVRVAGESAEDESDE